MAQTLCLHLYSIYGKNPDFRVQCTQTVLFHIETFGETINPGYKGYYTDIYIQKKE